MWPFLKEETIENDHKKTNQPAGSVAVKDMGEERDDTKWMFLTGSSYHIA